MGTWFADLTDGIKSECLYHFSALILAMLQQKNTGLSGHSTLDFLIMGTDDGYFVLYQLAQLCGHPLLNPFPTALHEPIQSMDNDLAAYIAHWIQYLTAQALSGCFLSDWYFIIKFVIGLHASLHFSIGTDLEHHIDHPHYDNCPLPFDFTPAHLWVRLQQCAQLIGFCGQVLSAPQDVQWNSNVQQIVSSILPPNDKSSINVDMVLVAILSLGPACLFCHDASHTAEKCPLLLCTKSDPFTKCIVLHLLQESVQAGSQNLDPCCVPSSATCLNTQSTSRIHAINFNEEMEPNNITDQQLPPDAVVN